MVFSDVVMPGMTGLELAGKLKQRSPQVPILLTTGYSDRIAEAGSQGYPVVRKPYRMETLAVAVNEALANQRKTLNAGLEDIDSRPFQAEIRRIQPR